MSNKLTALCANLIPVFEVHSHVLSYLAETTEKACKAAFEGCHVIMQCQIFCLKIALTSGSHQLWYAEDILCISECICLQHATSTAAPRKQNSNDLRMAYSSSELRRSSWKFIGMYAACKAREELVVCLDVGLAIYEVGIEEDRCIASVTAVQCQFWYIPVLTVLVRLIEGLDKWPQCQNRRISLHVFAGLYTRQHTYRSCHWQWRYRQRCHPMPFRGSTRDDKYAYTFNIHNVDVQTFSMAVIWVQMCTFCVF